MQKTNQQFLISVAPLTRVPLTRDQSFFYTFDRELFVGDLVEVPIGNRKVEGVVTSVTQDFPRESNFVLRKLNCALERKFLTKQQLELAGFISASYLSPMGIVLKHFIPKRVQMRGSVIHKKTKQKKIITTPSQKKIIQKIQNTKKSKKFFLHITNQSDKLAVLFTLMQSSVQKDKQVLYLLPELMQTPYFKAFIYHFFPADEIVLLHSKMSRGEFYKNWKNIKIGKAKVIIGTRTALFAPFQNLNLLVVDEAHDMSHKQWDHNPLFDSRTVSSELARIFDCTHIMTSATPRALDWYHKNHRTDTKFLSLIQKQKATIEIVDMKKERWNKNKSPLSRTLVSQIKYALKDHKQTLLFVNRQGMSAFSICSKCRTITKCPQCTRALISINKGQHTCVHCNYIEKTHKNCLLCKSPIEHIGIGTQKIARELKKIFPKSNIAVADSSTMQKAGAHNKLYKDFADGRIDIVIGTQMITKGWNSNNIRVSAVVDTDHLLSLPQYDVNEKTFAFIVQMALRAGKGKMIIQTFQPDDPVVQYASKYNFKDFYDEELSLRKALGYPPYIHLIKLVYQNASKKEVNKTVKKKYEELLQLSKNMDSTVISQPYSPIVNKIRTKYRKQIIIKNKKEVIPTELHTFLVSQNINWTIDIDPATII